MSDTPNLFFLQCSFVQTNWVKHCHFIGCLYWLTGAVASALVKQKLAQVILKKQKQAVLERTNSNPLSTASVAYRLEATLIAAQVRMCTDPCAYFHLLCSDRELVPDPSAPLQPLLPSTKPTLIEGSDEPTNLRRARASPSNIHIHMRAHSSKHDITIYIQITHTHLRAGGRAGRSAGVCVIAFQLPWSNTLLAPRSASRQPAVNKALLSLLIYLWKTRTLPSAGHYVIITMTGRPVKPKVYLFFYAYSSLAYAPFSIW